MKDLPTQAHPPTERVTKLSFTADHDVGDFTAVSLDIFGVKRFVVDSNQDQQGL